MLKREIADFVYSLFAKYDLEGWNFAFDRAKRRAGRCSYTKKLITLSIFFVDNNTKEEIVDTVLHEVSHAIAGPGTGHGPVWKAVCLKIGAKPVRCYDHDTVKMPKGDYKAVCPNCGRDHYKHRKVKRKYFCTPCGQEKGILIFQKMREYGVA